MNVTKKDPVVPDLPVAQESQLIPEEYGPERKVPAKDRTFRFWDLFMIWFGAGVNTGSWFFGALFASLGLAVAIAFDVVVASLVMVPWAMLGFMAQRTGTTTVGITRMSLGTNGSRVVMGTYVMVVGGGWAGINCFIAAISLSYIFNIVFGWATYGEPGALGPMVLGIAIVAIGQGAFAIAGRNVIKIMEWITAFALLALGIYETYMVLSQWSLGDLLSWKAATPYLGWGLMLDILIGGQWAWLQIGDFSRFAKTGRSGALGPWVGVNIGQAWFFTLGSLGVIAVALQSGVFDPNQSDPSSIMAKLGLGWIAFAVIVLATVNTDALNIYASGMGLKALLGKRIRARGALWIVTFASIGLCFLPLAFGSFVDYFTEFINFTAALIAGIWPIVLVDYFLLRKKRHRDEDLFAERGGRYWYSRGWNLYALVAWLSSCTTYWIITYVLPDSVQNSVSASIPAIIVAVVVYWVLGSLAIKRNYINV